MNEMTKITTRPLVLLIDGTKNVHGWEYEFSDKLWRSLHDDGVPMVGDGPVRLASALALGETLADVPQDAELALLLFVHGGRQPRLEQPRLGWQTINACYQKTKHLAHGKMIIGSGREQDIASHIQMAKVGLPIALLFLLISLFMVPLAPLSYFVWTILIGLFFGGCTVLNQWSAGGASSMIWFMLGIGTLTMGRLFLEIEILSPSFKEYSGWLAIQYGAILFSVAFSGWLLLRKRIERFLGLKNSSPDS